MIVKPVFLCDVSVHRNQYSKLQKADKGDRTRVKRLKHQKVFTTNGGNIAQKNYFHYHNLVFILKLIL